MSDFDPDDFLGRTRAATERKPVRRAPKAAAFDPDAFLAGDPAEDAEAAPLPAFDPNASIPRDLLRPPETRPPQPDRAEHLRKQLASSMLPEPGVLDSLRYAFDPNEVAKDETAAIRKIGDRLSFGLEPKVAEALGKTKLGAKLGFPPPGTYAQTEKERPLASGIAEVPAAALGMISGPAELAGMAGRGAAEVTGMAASRAPQAIKTGAEAAIGSGLYGAADTALRGGSPAEVGEAGLVSAGTGALASLAPPALGAVEDFAHQRVLSSAMKPLTETAKKMQGKALTQFGHGEGKEMGMQEMRDFVDRENLQPVLRSRKDMEQKFSERRQGVWNSAIEPIYDKAFEVAPKATVPMKEIEAAVKSVVPSEKLGTGYSKKVNAILDHIKASSEEIPGKNSSLNFPLKNFYEVAKEVQASGYSGVVNYDTPTQAKEVARDVGGALRKLFNERIARIYAANPKAAQELLGQSGRGTLTKPTSIPETLLTDPDVQEVGANLRAGNKRYSDYAKLTPVINDAAERAAEQRGWLPNMLRSGLGMGAGSVLGGAAGHLIGGHGYEGAAAGMMAVEGARRAAPYAWRGLESAAGVGAGPAVNTLAPPRLDQPLSRADLARMLGSPVGVAALRNWLQSRKADSK